MCWIFTLFCCCCWWLARLNVFVRVCLLFLVCFAFSYHFLAPMLYAYALVHYTATLYTIQYFDSKAERVRSVFFSINVEVFFCAIRSSLEVWQIFIMYIFIITEKTVSCAVSACECSVCVCKLAPLSSVCDGDWTIRKIILIHQERKKEMKWNETNWNGKKTTQRRTELKSLL